MTTDPLFWSHARGCDYHPMLGKGVCDCGLSALRDAVAAGDPLAVLDVLGMGGTLEFDTSDQGVSLYRVVGMNP